MKKLLVAVMSLSVVAFAAAPAAAQDGTGTGVGADVQPAVVLANKKQTKVTIDTATVLANLPINNYVAIDGAKVLNCGTVTCVLSADIVVQVGPTSPAVANDCPIAMRFVVDGNIVAGSDFFVNVIDTVENDFYFDNASTSISTQGSVAAGNHTVQTFIGSFGGNACARRNYHHVTYRQYKP